MLLIDRVGYKEWCIPSINFYRFNVDQNLAVWFGNSNMFFHVFVTVPVLFTSMLPLVFYGIYLSAKRKISNNSATSSGPASSAFANCEPAIVALGTLIIYSFAGHKEYRFLFSVLPIGLCYASAALSYLYGRSNVFYYINKPLDGVFSFSNPFDENSHFSRRSFSKVRRLSNSVISTNKWMSKNNSKFLKLLSRKKLILLIILLTNIPIGLFSNILHTRGVISVMKFLRESSKTGEVMDIGFLTPCHSTPFYSHIHRPIPMWFLTCDPPQNKKDLDNHYWEANEFDLNPVTFLKLNFIQKNSRLASPIIITDQNSNVNMTVPKLINLDEYNALPEDEKDDEMYKGLQKSRKIRYLPSHLVIYSSILPRIEQYLHENGYSQCASFFNTLFEVDNRRRGDILVFCKN
ncbi:GPI mannosyltransferase 3 [Smittium culicis]|uniref:Mannosyltransferase n=1 Tax=Smittium culicis TaxID=133412 RepID=A0A1R1Y4I2_9FUNG|nr:GPI mannosyltransferase 3 [Smittium culicis]